MRHHIDDAAELLNGGHAHVGMACVRRPTQAYANEKRAAQLNCNGKLDKACVYNQERLVSGSSRVQHRAYVSVFWAGSSRRNQFGL